MMLDRMGGDLEKRRDLVDCGEADSERRQMRRRGESGEDGDKKGVDWERRRIEPGGGLDEEGDLKIGRATRLGVEVHWKREWVWGIRG